MTNGKQRSVTHWADEKESGALLLTALLVLPALAALPQTAT